MATIREFVPLSCSSGLFFLAKKSKKRTGTTCRAFPQCRTIRHLCYSLVKQCGFIKKLCGYYALQNRAPNATIKENQIGHFKMDPGIFVNIFVQKLLTQAKKHQRYTS